MDSSNEEVHCEEDLLRDEVDEDAVLRINLYSEEEINMEQPNSQAPNEYALWSLAKNSHGYPLGSPLCDVVKRPTPPLISVPTDSKSIISAQSYLYSNRLK